MSGRIRLLKVVDALVGRAGLYLAWLIAPEVRRTQAVTSILIIRPGGIGDAVQILPMIKALHGAYPGVAIDVLAEKRNAGVFPMCPLVRRILHYDRPGELWRAIRGGYDVVIDSEQWYHLSAAVARIARPAMSIGFATNERARMFTHQVPYSHDRYEAESFLDLLAPLQVPPDGLPHRYLDPPAACAARADELLSPLPGHPLVAIFPGASIPERRWGEERFRQVAAGLSRHGFGCVVVGGGQDAPAGEAIVAGGTGLNLAGRTTLAETAAVVDRCRLLISADSGILHIAVALGRPTVALFGPGRARKWAPRGDRHVVINHELPCSPCTTFGTTPPCPNDVCCMRDITPEAVLAAALSLLDNP